MAGFRSKCEGEFLASEFCYEFRMLIRLIFDSMRPGVLEIDFYFSRVLDEYSGLSINSISVGLDVL